MLVTEPPPVNSTHLKIHLFAECTAEPIMPFLNGEEEKNPTNRHTYQPIDMPIE